jgi:four helix bundle protein
MKDFRNYQMLKVSHQIVLLVYKYSQDFPWEEANGITNQLRFTALSIPKGISEMITRDLNNGYDFFLNNAISLIDKLRYLLLLSFHLGYLKKADRKNILVKISVLKKELNSLYKEVEDCSIN